MPERLHAFILGDVQGVSFALVVGEEAMRLGLRGWVRNRRDGRVEVLAEGAAFLDESFSRGFGGAPASPGWRASTSIGPRPRGVLRFSDRSNRLSPAQL